MSPDSCVFCRIVAGEAPSTDLRRSVHVGVRTVSFVPLSPVTPGHRLFVPEHHAVDAASNPHVTGATFQAAAAWAEQQHQDFNLITSAGRGATQTVFHLHVHYVPRVGHDGLELPWTKQVSVQCAGSRGDAP